MENNKLMIMDKNTDNIDENEVRYSVIIVKISPISVN